MEILPLPFRQPSSRAGRGKISAIILAGGSSRRMGEGRDKLQHPILRYPLLVHSLLAFDRCDVVHEIVLVVREDRLQLFQAWALEYGLRKLAKVVSGGIERQDSVGCGLQALSPSSKIVLIHDGARPCVTSEIITRCAEVARLKGAAIPAVRVRDTIKRVPSNSGSQEKEGALKIETTLDRSNLWAAQTPQAFRVELIRRAYELLARERVLVTDDATAVERLGHDVWIVESDPANFKVTTPEDLQIAEVILSSRL